MAATPYMWQFNQGWSTAISANFPPLITFIKDIDFARLTNLVQAQVTVSGATAYGIKSDQVTFGWMTGAFSGKSLSVAGVANNSYVVTWFDCTAGTVISTGSASVTNGTLTAAIPATSVADIAFKAISPVQVVAQSTLRETHVESRMTYENGVLRLSQPITKNSDITIMTALGRVVAHCKVMGANPTLVPVGRLGQGVYIAAITLDNNKTLLRLMVK
jgi:hypothetical protein